MKISVIDLETGGFDSKAHGTTQVAAINGVLYEDKGAVRFGVLGQFHELLAPLPGFYYDKHALEYQRMDMETLTQEGSNPTGLVTRLSTFIEPTWRLGPGRIWAQEDMFDFSFLKALYEYDRVAGNNDRRVHEWIGTRSDWSCSKRLARFCRAFGLLDCESDSLDPVCKRLGIERPTFTDLKPVQDCWMTGNVVAALTTRLGLAGHPYYLSR
jgi:hypothetical protein